MQPFQVNIRRNIVDPARRRAEEEGGARGEDAAAGAGAGAATYVAVLQLHAKPLRADRSFSATDAVDCTSSSSHFSCESLLLRVFLTFLLAKLRQLSFLLRQT